MDVFIYNMIIILFIFIKVKVIYSQFQILHLKLEFILQVFYLSQNIIFKNLHGFIYNLYIFSHKLLIHLFNNI